MEQDIIHCHTTDLIDSIVERTPW